MFSRLIAYQLWRIEVLLELEYLCFNSSIDFSNVFTLSSNIPLAFVFGLAFEILSLLIIRGLLGFLQVANCFGAEIIIVVSNNIRKC